MNDHLKNDRLRGVQEIAEFIGENERRTYYLLEQGAIPGGKIAAQWSRARLNCSSITTRSRRENDV